MIALKICLFGRRVRICQRRCSNGLSILYFEAKEDLANQLQRAALSISNNIAEGFERGSTKELINFLYIARGSAGEVRSMLSVMERTTSLDCLKSEIAAFKQACESISRQLRGWADSLQNSDIGGQKHLNDRSRTQYESRKRKVASRAKHQQWQREFELHLRAKAHNHSSAPSPSE